MAARSIRDFRFLRYRTSALALVAVALGVATSSGAVQAAPTVWQVFAYPSRAAIAPCKAVNSFTARGAVLKCFSKVGIGLPFTDAVVTAAPVCQTTHVATSTLGTGYVYSKTLAPALTPTCAP